MRQLTEWEIEQVVDKVRRAAESLGGRHGFNERTCGGITTFLTFDDITVRVRMSIDDNAKLARMLDDAKRANQVGREPEEQHDDSCEAGG
jgi:hypothetical protein